MSIEEERVNIRIVSKKAVYIKSQSFCEKLINENNVKSRVKISQLTKIKIKKNETRTSTVKICLQYT